MIQRDLLSKEEKSHFFVVVVCLFVCFGMLYLFVCFGTLYLFKIVECIYFFSLLFDIPLQKLTLVHSAT